MNGESSVEVRDGSFAFEKGSLQPENRSSPGPSSINRRWAGDVRWNAAGMEPNEIETRGAIRPRSQSSETNSPWPEGEDFPRSVSGLLLFGGRFLCRRFGSRFSGFFGNLFGGFLDRELFWSGSWFTGDLFGQFVERLADVFFEFCQGFGEAVGAFANLFESGSAFGA